MPQPLRRYTTILEGGRRAPSHCSSRGHNDGLSALAPTLFDYLFFFLSTGAGPTGYEYLPCAACPRFVTLYSVRVVMALVASYVPVHYTHGHANALFWFSPSITPYKSALVPLARARTGRRDLRSGSTAQRHVGSGLAKDLSVFLSLSFSYRLASDWLASLGD